MRRTNEINRTPGDPAGDRFGDEQAELGLVAQDCEEWSVGPAQGLVFPHVEAQHDHDLGVGYADADQALQPLLVGGQHEIDPRFVELAGQAQLMLQFIDHALQCQIDLLDRTLDVLVQHASQVLCRDLRLLHRAGSLL